MLIRRVPLVAGCRARTIISRDRPCNLFDNIEFWCFEELGALDAYANVLL
jgi:hypothetical protein